MLQHTIRARLLATSCPWLAGRGCCAAQPSSTLSKKLLKVVFSLPGAGGVCFLPPLSAPADDGAPLSPPTQQLPQQRGAEGEALANTPTLLDFSRPTDVLHLFFLFFPQEFLLKIFCVFRNLMKLTIFPRDWSVMRLLTSQ